MVNRHRAVAAAMCACAWAALAAPACATKPATSTCPPGFDLGPVARADFPSLPRSAAAIEAGLVDEAGILAGFDRYDKNTNGVICVQLSVGFQTNNRPFGQYLYNVSDDTSSAQS